MTQLDPTPSNFRSTRPQQAHARVLVAGLVRNGQEQVAADVRRLQKALMDFADVQWLLVESDSQDRTLDQLELLRGQVPGFRYLALGCLRDRLPQRTARIAHCRNAYLELLEVDPAYADIDFVLVADFDGINTLIDAAGVQSCWQRADWDVCTANQSGPYYDIWALRHELWSPNDCKASHQFLVDGGLGHEAALEATVFSRMITIATDAPWIEVDSAFGGLAVYRRAVLRGLRYDGLTPSGAEVCEHVALHAAIRARGGRIFLNPRLVCSGRTEHTRPLRLVNKLARLTRQATKRVLAAVLPRRFAALLAHGGRS